MLDVPHELFGLFGGYLYQAICQPADPTGQCAADDPIVVVKIGIVQHTLVNHSPEDQRCVGGIPTIEKLPANGVDLADLAGHSREAVPVHVLCLADVAYALSEGVGIYRGSLTARRFGGQRELK